MYIIDLCDIGLCYRSQGIESCINFYMQPPAYHRLALYGADFSIMFHSLYVLHLMSC